MLSFVARAVSYSKVPIFAHPLNIHSARPECIELRPRPADLERTTLKPAPSRGHRMLHHIWHRMFTMFEVVDWTIRRGPLRSARAELGLAIAPGNQGSSRWSLVLRVRTPAMSGPHEVGPVRIL